MRKLMARYMSPAGDDGADNGGTGAAPDDRGDVVDPATATDADGDDAAGGPDDDAAAAAGTGDGAAPADPDDGQQEDARHGGIPKARFDQVNNQRKQLAAENERLQRELEAARTAKAPPAPAPAPAAAPAATPAPAADKFDPDAQEEAYIQALLEGDSSKAGKIRREINAHLVAQASEQAEAKVSSREAAKLLEAEVATTMEAHPWLDTPAGADALELIVAARNASVARGVPAHKALRDAVAKIAPRFKPEADTPAGELPGDGAPADTRTANALKRGATDSVAQPPVVAAGVGNRATAGRVNVAQLDEDQFANLSDAEKRRLRGD